MLDNDIVNTVACSNIPCMEDNNLTKYLIELTLRSPILTSKLSNNNKYIISF